MARLLACRGGSNTSAILRWLLNQGCDVISFVGNVGQQDNFAVVEKKALKTGASHVHVQDLREESVTDYISWQV